MTEILLIERFQVLNIVESGVKHQKPTNTNQHKIEKEERKDNKYQD